MACFDASHNREMDSQEDRLSALPDDLILRILSLLELKLATATSILSPRWRYLWTSVHNLDLGEWGRFSPGKYNAQSICLSLAQFNSPKIRKFRAFFFGHASKDFEIDFEIDMWIRLAVDRHVEEVDLFLEETPRYKVVGCLLNCGSLEVLKLFLCDLNLQASPLCLPLLKLLDLDYVNFSTLDTSGCPLLERLILKECNRGEPLDIYAPNKKLGYLEICDHQTVKLLTIFAPYVCSILFQCNVRRAYDIKELSSLRTATLKYANIWSDMRPEVGPIVQLFRSVFHASVLELSIACVEFLTFLKAGVELPPLRTTCMKLNITCNKSYLAGMSRLLSSAPYLEKLILGVDPYRSHMTDFHMNDYDLSDLFNLLEHSLSTIHSLKSVEVNFTGTRLGFLHNSVTTDEFFCQWEKDIKLLKLLLNSCMVLQKMTISTIEEGYKTRKPKPLKPEFLVALQNRVLAFPKASLIAEICFSQNPVIV